MLALQIDANPSHVFVFGKNIIVQSKHTSKHTKAFLQKLQINVDFGGGTHPLKNLEIDDPSHLVSFLVPSCVYFEKSAISQHKGLMQQEFFNTRLSLFIIFVVIVIVSMCPSSFLSIPCILEADGDLT